jgi:NADH-quinone oxidoreductase subunit J
MSAFDIFFYLFALIIGVSALMAVLVKNIVHAAFSLLFTFRGVAGTYVLLSADFLAVTQILVYVGGILVLLIFGVMLTNKVTDINIKAGAASRIPAALLVLVLAAVLGFVALSTKWPTHKDTPWSNTQQWSGNVYERIESTQHKTAGDDTKGSIGTAEEIGKLMLTDHLLPFEVISVLLLVALVGAAMLARKHPMQDDKKLTTAEH